MLTCSEVNTDLFSTIKAEARAYISRNVSLENLIRIMALVADGEVIVSPPMATRLLAEFNFLEEPANGAKVRTINLLTKREQEVLSLVEQGFTNREIATTLCISEHTVKVHARNIMEKLHAHTRQQAVSVFTQRSILHGTLLY